MSDELHEGGGARGGAGLARVREYRAAERLLHADPAEIRALADRRLTAVIAAARTVEPYRTLWEGCREVRSVRDLAELPITERDHLQDAPIETRLARPREGLSERYTSGTTAAFLLTARSPDEVRFMDVQMWRQFRTQGIPANARRLNIELNPPLEPAILDVGSRVVRVSMPKSSAAIAEVIRSEGIEVMLGTPSALLEVAETMGSRTMKGVVTFGEVRTDIDVDALREAYGVRPMDWYASGEAMLVSWECPSGSGYHVNSDAVVLEVLDPDGRAAGPGEPGDVVLTALANCTTPVVRYRIGDIASLLPDPCPCGITLPLMGAVEGRTPDWIIAPGGRRISPFRVVLGALLGEETAPAVRRYRVTQRAVDDFLVEVVWAAGRRADLAERIGPALTWVLEAPVHVETRELPEIRVGPSEKFRQVVSLVSRSETGRSVQVTR